MGIEVGLAETAAALKAIAEELTDIETVFDYWPQNIEGAEFPAIVIAEGNGAYDPTPPSTMFQIDRQWTVTVFHDLLRQKREGEVYKAGRVLHQTVKYHLIKVRRLFNDSNEEVGRLTWTGDNGLRETPYPRGSNQLFLTSTFSCEISTEEYTS